MFSDIKKDSDTGDVLQDESGPQNSEPKPKIIGLTGGIGSGKTTVAKFIEKMGFPVYYSDVRAKEIVNDDEDLKQKIKDLLGGQAYDENNLYDRKFVSEKVFNDEDLLLKLNALIHPAVKTDFENWVQKQNAEFIFKETALLFELKLNENCYKSVLVTADDNIRTKRVMDRDGKTYREVENIMEKQMLEKDKIKLANYVIYNNDGFEELQLQTKKLMENFN
ncbi:MAG: dephospho-CoA kinase [Kaistella sp.]|nr:dephospho-CoA kinase [Kaistella sp.]